MERTDVGYVLLCVFQFEEHRNVERVEKWEVF